MRTLNFSGTRHVTFTHHVELEFGPLSKEVALLVEADVFGGEKRTFESPGYPFEVEILSMRFGDGTKFTGEGYEDGIIQEAIERAEDCA